MMIPTSFVFGMADWQDEATQSMVRIYSKTNLLDPNLFPMLWMTFQSGTTRLCNLSNEI